MTKEAQQKVNEICREIYSSFRNEYDNYPFGHYRKIGRLYTCSANIYETDKFIVLVSYSTIVALIDKKDNSGYDVLRLVFGYTSTSAQHIRKFFNKYNVILTYSYRAI
ncbi:MAG: hypothetical protein J6Q48_07370 [Bacteroidaceae bacterium]|nr:hypothetical protein [Bacteroidaceae bacterium]